MPPGRSVTKMRLLLAASAATALLLLPAAIATPGTTTRVSLSTESTEANGASQYPAISGEGRVVAFRSNATNLVAADTNGVEDIFVRDRDTGLTTRVSVGSAGAQANNASHGTAISGDGRFVAFESDATNLVPGDTNARTDVFVHDRETGITARVNVSSEGEQADRVSGLPVLSADGRFVAFNSEATNLVAADTNGVQDIFVRDRSSSTTTRVNVSSSGEEADRHSLRPAISPDGRFVAFESNAHNLVPGEFSGLAEIFVHDRVTGQTTRESVSSESALSNDNSY